jgi:hypothetical protein
VAPPYRKVRFSFSGFTPGRPIYGHFVHRGHLVRAVRYGGARGACGMLHTRAAQYPGGHPRYSSYIVQFDSRSRYSKRTRPRYLAKLTLS